MDPVKPLDLARGALDAAREDVRDRAPTSEIRGSLAVARTAALVSIAESLASIAHDMPQRPLP